MTMLEYEQPDVLESLRRQAWFWTPEWQEGERNVDEHVRNDEVTVFDSGEGFVDFLDSLISE